MCKWIVLFAFLLVAPGAADADVVIGVAGPMTGSLAEFGAQIAAGAKQAVADINAAGGIKGQSLRLEIGDDACDPKQATAVAERMVADNVALVVGHLCSGTAISASAVYSAARVVNISPAVGASAFTDARPAPGVFRLVGRDDVEGQLVGNMLANNRSSLETAIVDDGTPEAKTRTDAALSTLSRLGQSIGLSISLTNGDQDYSSVVSTLKSRNVDIVYFAGGAAEAGALVRGMKEQGLQATLIGGETLADPQFAISGGDAIVGTIMIAPPDPTRLPEAAGVVAKLRAEGIEPTAYAIDTYAAVQVWAKAADAEDLDFDHVVQSLGTGTFATVIGNISFDPKGNLKQSAVGFSIWAKDGQCGGCPKGGACPQKISSSCPCPKPGACPQ